MERYHFFASTCREFGFGVRSLSESMQDERESDGALATILDVLNIVTNFLGRWGRGTGSRYVVRYLREIFTLWVENKPVNLGWGR
jgi:hypothetical protein